jgi:3,4-dihydroxy 2-butanone 4-phosphate synthase / GTP cyclohydrolase II
VTADVTAPAVLPRGRTDRGARPSAVGRRPPAGPADGADPVERVRAALSDVAAGRPVVLVDDEDGGDLVVAAELATPEVLSFVVRHTAGFVCVAVPEEDADRLDLPLMVGTDRDRPGAQCVAVDAATVGTGISATDRAATIRLLAAPDSVPSDLVRPGHVVPLRVRAGGLLGHRGRAEAAVDLAGLAGSRPAAALCQVVSTVDSTQTARGPELGLFAREHGLRLVTISDLVAYRLRFEKLVERGAAAVLPLPAGSFTAIGYRDRVSGCEHLALVHGEIGAAEDVAVHVHAECLLGDTLGSTPCGCGEHLRSALAGIADEGRGVVIYLWGDRSGTDPVRGAVRPHHDTGARPPGAVEGSPGDHGVAGAILRDLGVRSTRSTGAHLGRRCAART